MILITGGTGFIGRALIRHLADRGYSLRILLHPSKVSPNLEKGVSVEVAVCSLNDARGLRAAMKGVDTVYHLAGSEWRGVNADLLGVDIDGTKSITQAAQDANVKRIFFLSHLNVDRASAFPVFKAKAIGETFIKNSGLDYTIIRSAIVFGSQDKFTNALAAMISSIPFIFPGPGDGETLLQPIWVEDLATCLVWGLDDADTRNKVFEIGGPEYLSYKGIVNIIMEKIKKRRNWVSIPLPYLRPLSVLAEQYSHRFPISGFWLDYLTINRTCALDTVPRCFGLIPARFENRLDYLDGQNWRKQINRQLRRR
jgi:NADH dehydrogenase